MRICTGGMGAAWLRRPALRLLTPSHRRAPGHRDAGTACSVINSMSKNAPSEPKTPAPRGHNTTYVRGRARHMRDAPDATSLRLGRQLIADRLERLVRPGADRLNG